MNTTILARFMHVYQPDHDIDVQIIALTRASSPDSD